MTTRLLLILASFALLSAQRVLAHRPYEHAAGIFRRGDGQNISIVEHYVDGILGDDPVAIQFRLRDGTVVAATDYTVDAIIRHTPPGIEVFQFSSTWIPVASKVQRFDGYSLTEITTSTKRLLSPLLHTRNHWISYVVALGFAALLFGSWFTTSAIPRRGSLAALRMFAFTVEGLGTALYVLFVLWLAPLSPIILGLFGAICVALYFLAKRCVPHAQTAHNDTFSGNTSI